MAQDDRSRTTAGSAVGRGRFITFEGGEGAGKSTQLALLAAHMEMRGIPVVRTREPGGTPGAEAIRDLLVTGAANRWDPLTETLLFTAARRDHVRRRIEPALAAGTWVLCDRFIDSTLAYQSLGGAVAAHDIVALHDLATGGLWPDLTLLIDLDPAVGLARAAARGDGENRYEAKGLEFHTALRERFLSLAQAHASRIVRIDAARLAETVAADIAGVVDDRLVQAWPVTS